MIRFFDVLFSFLGLIILSPVFLLIFLLIVLESKGGGFYIQKRVGKNNVDFKLFKFRSMHVGADKKGLITVGGNDPRTTKTGQFLRKYKLDELPQLFNVLKGDMSLVGPRPEVRKYVDMYTPEQRKVLSIRPGITDYASIIYSDENERLGKAFDPEKVYVEEIMPHKILLNLRYILNPNLRGYFHIVFATIRHLIKNKK